MLTKANSNLENKCTCVKCGVNDIFNKNNMFCKKCYDDDYNKPRKVRPRARRIRKNNDVFENNLLARIKYKSKLIGLDFNIDLDWIKGSIEKGVCEATNIPFIKPTLPLRKMGEKLQFIPTIDRVDETKGYTKDNCQMVVMFYSYIKCVV